jgi:hypothetical protein
MRPISIGILLCVLAVGLLTPLHRLRSPDPFTRRVDNRYFQPPPPRTPSQKALREAVRSWCQAQEAVNAQIERLQEWDPAAVTDPAIRQMRRELLVLDSTGHLSRAHDAALQAQSRAETGHERCRAMALLARIEHDLGNHEPELLLAQAMVKQEPRDWTALAVLRRAAKCNGHAALERRALQKLRACAWRYYKHNAKREGQ